MVYKIYSINSNAVYFSKSKHSLKSHSDEQKRSVRNCIAIVIRKELQNTARVTTFFSWGQEKVVDRENRLIPRTVKETIHPLKIRNNINKISHVS